MPVENALAVYAALVAPLPGIEPIAGAGDLPHEAATIASRALTGAFRELDPGVAAVIEEDLVARGDEPDDIVVEPGRRAHRDFEPGAGAGSGDVPTRDELAATIAGIVANLESRSSHEMRIPVRARIVDFAAGWSADANAVEGSSGRPSSCVIRIQRRLFGDDELSVTSTLAHEVWHCFQADTHAEAFWTGPLWIIEGQAEWAGEAYVGGSSSSASSWNNWLLRPDLALIRRAYDAIGIYAVAGSHGADPWTTMLPMLGRATPRAVSTLFAGIETVPAIGRVATAVTRVPEYGSEWESTGPGITGATAARVMSVPTEGFDEASATVGRFGTMPLVLAITAGGEVLRIEVSGGSSGSAALPGVGTVSIAPGGHADFCMRPEGCTCPDGSNPGGGGELPSAGPGEGAAAVGATDGGRVSVRAGRLSLDDVCSPGLVGQWATTVQAVFAELTRPYGEGPACEGPFRAEFTEDGHFSSGFQATCVVGDQSATGVAQFAGTYTTADVDGQSTFSVDNISGEGTMTIMGTTMPLPIIDGYRQSLSGPVPYTIVGDQLTYWFTAPDGNTFTFVLTRVG